MIDECKWSKSEYNIACVGWMLKCFKFLHVKLFQSILFIILDSRRTGRRPASWIQFPYYYKINIINILYSVTSVFVAHAIHARSICFRNNFAHISHLREFVCTKNESIFSFVIRLYSAIESIVVFQFRILLKLFAVKNVSFQFLHMKNEKLIPLTGLCLDITKTCE